MFHTHKMHPEFLGLKLRAVAGESAYPSDKEIGVELELEGFGAGYMAGIPSDYWKAHADPSLRGDCIELCLRHPLTLREFEDKAIPEFDKIKEKSDFKPALSARCSVHVHLDFSHKTVYALYKFITLYALLEECFFDVVGKNRRGNPFCLRLSDAPGFVQDGITAFSDKRLAYFHAENNRYMALNLASLYKFGSVEIRLHSGEHESDKIVQWVRVLHELMCFAVKSPMSPSEILQGISMHGFRGFLRAELPITYRFIADVPHVYESVGIDVAQDFAFACQWPTPEELERKSESEDVWGTIVNPEGLKPWKNAGAAAAARKMRVIPMGLDIDPPDAEFGE